MIIFEVLKSPGDVETTIDLKPLGNAPSCLDGKTLYHRWPRVSPTNKAKTICALYAN